MSFQSILPALFPINNLFKLAQETSQTDKVNTTAVKENENVDSEEKLTTKKDKRKLRHEKFLKSEQIRLSEYSLTYIL